MLADKCEAQNQKIVGITSIAAEPVLIHTEGVQTHYFVQDGGRIPVCIVSESILDALTEVLEHFYLYCFMILLRV